jgi:hypothetical protein
MYLLADQYTDQNVTERASKTEENWTYYTTFQYVPFYRNIFTQFVCCRRDTND